jgi:hypothetical protein
MDMHPPEMMVPDKHSVGAIEDRNQAGQVLHLPSLPYLCLSGSYANFFWGCGGFAAIHEAAQTDANRCFRLSG